MKNNGEWNGLRDSESSSTMKGVVETGVGIPMGKKQDPKRRDFLKKAAYSAPAVLTLQAVSGVAKGGKKLSEIDRMPLMCKAALDQFGQS